MRQAVLGDGVSDSVEGSPGTELFRTHKVNRAGMRKPRTLVLDRTTRTLRQLMGDGSVKFDMLVRRAAHKPASHTYARKHSDTHAGARERARTGANVWSVH